jgi:hypothetical protein
MTSSEFNELIHQSQQYSSARIAESILQYGLSRHARWDTNSEQGKIWFSDAQGHVRVSADIQVAGSFSFRSNTWMWGWHNNSIPEISKSLLRQVRDFGEAEQIPVLTNPAFASDEAEAGDLTAVAGKLLKADGFYRAPDETSVTYLLLFSFVRHADGDQELQLR